MTTDDSTRHPYQNPQLPVDRRVEDLLGRLSLEDKAGLLFHSMVFAGDVDDVNPMLPLVPPRKMIAEHRLTHFNVFGSTHDARDFAEWHNALQQVAAEHPLAIPITLSSDPRNHFTDNPLASMFAGPFSQWPETLGLAAIGSEDLVREFADTARREYLAVGLRVALHPQIDLATEPRWCRISSTFGEDADLTSRLLGPYIRGFQGESIGPTSVATMTKHFPGGGPQKDGEDPHFPWGREQVYPSGNFDYHLRPFRAALAAGTAQIMPYYGMPIGTDFEEVGFSYNRSIITGILREHLGFDGVVCTDWGLITDRPELGDVGTAKAWGVEHLSTDERLVKLVDAGVDQFGGEHCSDRIVALVRSGALTESRVDESVRRVLRQKFELGLFERPYVDEHSAAFVVGNPAFRAAGVRAQQRAVTILTNGAEGGSPILPLSRDVRVYAEGVDVELLGRFGTVVDTPADADVALLRVSTPWEPSGRGGFGDLFHTGSLEFPAEELDHISAICAAVPTVIDIYLERPAVVGWLVAAARAIVADYGIGDEALLGVLFGDVAPEGHLPFDLPASMAAVAASRSDAPFDTVDPVFRFGHGLRYDLSSPHV